MSSFLVAGVPAIAVVVGLVEAIKRVFGIEGERAIPIAIGLGIALSLATQAAVRWPGFAVWYEAVIAGVLVGLAACGLFDAGQAVKGKLAAKVERA